MLTMIFMIVGGIGLLLYAIEIMKDSLEQSTQGLGQKLLTMSSKSRYMAIAAGFVTTAINQKSTATTVMVIGMVNAGMMTLVHATGVIMGANIGTTITAQLLAFRLEIVSPFIVGVAAILWRVAKTKRHEYYAGAFLGFGLMFIGLFFMEKGFHGLSEHEQVYNFFRIDCSKSLLMYFAVLIVAIVLTVLVHSSSLMTGVFIALAAQDMLLLTTAIPLILGINIGKAVPTIVLGKDETRSSLRASLINLIFNMTGAIIVTFLLYHPMLKLVEFLTPSDLPRQIANAHTLFNLGTTLILMPFMGFIAKLSNKIVPAKSEIEEKKSMLDVRMLGTPGLALAISYNQIVRMAKMVIESFRLCVISINGLDQHERIWEIENVLLKEQKELEIYLTALFKQNLRESQKRQLVLILKASSEIEMITDISIDIADLARYSKEHSLRFSVATMDDITELYNKIQKSLNDLVEALIEHDTEKADEIISRDLPIEELTQKHINRLLEGACNPGTGVIYIDMINNMQHIHDHIKNIARFLIEVSKD